MDKCTAVNVFSLPYDFLNIFLYIIVSIYYIIHIIY